MPTIWVREFKDGLDSRRLPETSKGGTLLLGQDGHITNGGEFEKRAAFVKEYDLPANTVSLAANSGGLYVFAATGASVGTLPSGVSLLSVFPSALHTGQSLARVLSYDLFSDVLYVVGELGNGAVEHYYQSGGLGLYVETWVSGQAFYTFEVTGGTGASTVNITIDGIAIMAAAVTWATSNSATAAAIATAINSNVSVPDYTATSTGSFVTISTATGGSAGNGRTVGFTLVSGFTVSGVTPNSQLAGGTDGTFPEPGRFVKTIGARLLALAGSYVIGSGIQRPTVWTGITGAGFVDMAQSTSGPGTLKALAEYQNLVAVLSERVILLWNISADPADWAKSQVLRNTGTPCPRSVTQFGDTDIFYLDESGLRSLQARDSSNAAVTSDSGVAIDSLITAKLASLTDAEKSRVIGLVNPQDGRFWLIMKDVIYVLSVFPGSKVSAWTTYTTHYYVNGVKTSFNVDDAVVFNRRVYLRSGDSIFAYGGKTTGLTRDATVAEAWMPYLDGDDPTKEKTWTGFDAAVSGEWAVAAGMSLIDNTKEDNVGIVFRTTYNDERIGAIGRSTHISLRFRSRGSGVAKLSACALHYEE